MLSLSATFAPLASTTAKDEHVLETIERSWHEDLVRFAQHGLPKVLGALLIAFILQRLTLFLVARTRRHADRLVGNAARAAQLRTVAAMVRATSYGVIAAYLVLQILGAFGVPLGPFIASAGVIGLGISFGAQSLFKDILNGVFILIEDQFNVGEVVKIAGLQGTVEDLTLRVTKLRDGDGTVYIIPNSQIATVSNLSRDFSVATLAVSADSSADPDRVIAVLNALVPTVHADDAFKDIVLSHPSVLGVDRINGREVQYLINVRVRANQRDAVLRELRRRILQTFAAERIPLGIAVQQAVILSEARSA